MPNKTLLICTFILLMCQEVFSATKLEVKKISSSQSKKLVSSQADAICCRRIGCNGLVVSNDQAFKLTREDFAAYIISVTSRQHDPNYPASFICSTVVFNEDGTLVSGAIGVGSNKLRPWTCDTTEAMSFADYYPDGALRIIAVYAATAPSSERFIIPVVFKLNLEILKLVVDEKLTKLLDEGNVSTIPAARKLLRGY